MGQARGAGRLRRRRQRAQARSPRARASRRPLRFQLLNVNLYQLGPCADAHGKMFWYDDRMRAFKLWLKGRQRPASFPRTVRASPFLVL